MKFARDEFRYLVKERDTSFRCTYEWLNGSEDNISNDDAEMWNTFTLFLSNFTKL